VTTKPGFFTSWHLFWASLIGCMCLYVLLGVALWWWLA
jgi:hypothetical protein